MCSGPLTGPWGIFKHIVQSHVREIFSVPNEEIHFLGESQVCPVVQAPEILPSARKACELVYAFFLQSHTNPRSHRLCTELLLVEISRRLVPLHSK